MIFRKRDGIIVCFRRIVRSRSISVLGKVRLFRFVGIIGFRRMEVSIRDVTFSVFRDRRYIVRFG